MGGRRPTNYCREVLSGQVSCIDYGWVHYCLLWIALKIKRGEDSSSSTAIQMQLRAIYPVQQYSSNTDHAAVLFSQYGSVFATDGVFRVSVCFFTLVPVISGLSRPPQLGLLNCEVEVRSHESAGKCDIFSPYFPSLCQCTDTQQCTLASPVPVT